MYAKWNINVYTVTFETGEGIEVEAVEVNHGQTVAEPEEPTWDGHEFAGWFKDIGYTEEYDFDTPVEGDFTLFAKWELVETAAQLITKGGKIADLTSTFGPKAGATPTEQELGFYNAGYSYANAAFSIFLYSGDDAIFGGDAEGTEPAWWGYKIALTHLHDNVFIVEKNIGYAVDVPQGVYDYILTGIWRSDLYSGFEFVQFLAAGEILIIEGVDFAGEGGEVDGLIKKYAATSVDNYYGLTIPPGTVLPVPTKRGFVFAGWYDNPQYQGEAITTVTAATAATVFYAKWEEAPRLMITFETGITGINVYLVFRFDGEKVKCPADPVREGYTFTGWYTDEAHTTEFDFDTEIVANITLYAKWEEVTGEEE